jgi:hypothetical protein
MYNSTSDMVTSWGARDFQSQRPVTGSTWMREYAHRRDDFLGALDWCMLHA